jgi:hypothetical protein
VVGSLGFPVPREAEDQFERAPLKSRQGWESAAKDDLGLSAENP